MPSKLTGRRKIIDGKMTRRLSDQARVVRKADAIHDNPRLLREIAFYPEHDKRKETAAYQAVHRELTRKRDLPCLICGVRNSTLKKKSENRYGARAMETHHHVIEWALANAVDLSKFNKAILPNLAARHPENPVYKKRFSQQQLLAWVDHSPDNLWVLCDVHHRAQYVGVHEISYPIWGPQALLRADFLAHVDRELASVKAETAARAAKKRAKSAARTAKARRAR